MRPGAHAQHDPLSIVFEQLLVPRGLCLAEQSTAVPLCLTRGGVQPRLCFVKHQARVVLDQHSQETHLKWVRAKVNVYSATLPGGNSCRAEVREPVRAAVLQWDLVLVTRVTACPGLEVLG